MMTNMIVKMFSQSEVICRATGDDTTCRSADSRISRLLATAALLMLTAACAPSNPQMMAPQVEIEASLEQAPITKQVQVSPKVDILFVIDTSESMDVHQERLKANIDRFVESFERFDRLDFHIGVVSIFDSKRYGHVVKDFYPLGKFRPLKDPANPGKAVEGPQFITRTEGYSAILGETLKIGVEKRGEGSGGPKDLGGPEYEEMFLPVVAALDGRNEGFLREDAHLAVIFITDANDDSAYSSLQLQSYLRNLKGVDDEGNSMFSTYAALAVDSEEGKACKRDNTSGAPEKMEEFINLTHGKQFSLCSETYGDHLADAGQMIQKKASRVRIDLAAKPELGTIKVLFGGKPLVQDQVRGWTFDSDLNAIIISPDAELKGDASAKLDIEYVPVDPRAFKNGRAKPRQ